MKRLTVKNKVLLLIDELEPVTFLSVQYQIKEIEDSYWRRTYASKILLELYRSGLLTRVKEILPQGGIKYWYYLSKSGANKVDWLHQQGYDSYF
jgi:predicted transcriptional regulator